VNVTVNVKVNGNLAHQYLVKTACELVAAADRRQLRSSDIVIHCYQSINQPINQLYYSAPKSWPTANL